MELGCSFFEKWVVRLKVRRIARRSVLFTEAAFDATSTPAPCSRRSAAVRVEADGATRSRLELFSRPSCDAGGGSLRRSERVGEALRGPCSAPLNPVRPAGPLGGRVRRTLAGFVSPHVVRSDGGWCPIRRHEAPEIGDAGRAFPADGAEGPSCAWRSPPRPSPYGRDRDRPRSD